MTLLGFLRALLLILWHRVRGIHWAQEDWQEWIHERGYCVDPDCDFLKTERGKRFNAG